ncbi:WecB/TagA/CpsF family glycosyltransferase [Aquibacillus halophilus]|uniref:WecB/TagA/CpsF family glycosyltransferase n=1 Tax=Aquibacillus halophilus TaxID=930132 RepID=UPI001F1097FE|nr:WecB/TagA/CpsF family glycosyltransferase [Aquibacillus halophilus]
MPVNIPISNPYTTSIMDINFLNKSKQDLLNHHIYPILHNKVKSFIVTANPEIVMRAREDQAYKEAITRADYIIPDGAGIIVASRLLKTPIIERVPGFDLMNDLIAYAEIHSLSCYMLGAKEEVNSKMIGKLKEKHPNLTIAGNHHGYFDMDDRFIVNSVKNAQADLVFVALGFPRQENWITKHYHEFDKGLFMGVGGCFDVLAGEVKRAPDSWIKLNLEWLYRLLKQPFRWKRILKAIEFIIRIQLKRY